MEIKLIIAIVIIILAVLTAARISPERSFDQFYEGKFIHIDIIVIQFDKTNANTYIGYHLTPFAEAYMYLFGTRYLEPKIKQVFAEFNVTKIQEIGLNGASLTITNISKQEDQYYLHDSIRFGIPPDMLTIVYPDGSRRSYQKPVSTQNTFYTQ